MTPEDLISNSRVAAVVSDPRRPDNPIVACNDAFEALTGYSRAEVIGQNCRFLRGPATEAESTATLREAVAARRPVMVELVNYKRGGQPFRNAVMIAPIFAEDGELVFFLGSQMQIDEAGLDRSTDARARVTRLTRRQRQVLEAMARGRLNKQVAFDLHLSERTVKLHRAAVLRGLGVRSGAEAIRIAIEAGL